MFARVQTVHQPASRLDHLAEVSRRHLPDARELPGFRGYYFLADRDHEKALLISLWESEEDLRQLEAHAALRERAEADAGITSPPTEVYEVASHIG